MEMKKGKKKGSKRPWAELRLRSAEEGRSGRVDKTGFGPSGDEMTRCVVPSDTNQCYLTLLRPGSHYKATTGSVTTFFSLSD